ncbi:MAG TPA: gliding motility-associated ABC transporter substrate-binding protein GldG [Cytophagales bacterium]|nr:gliding motility-associated ABC transporter substrate-binding protein GldG [Cytophagales bacterium]
MKSRKSKDLIYFTIGLVVIVLINIIGSNYFFRIDLTEENRYTMSDATVRMLENLEEEVFIEVYLDGDLPSGFKRLQKSVREQLETFRAYGGDKIQFRFYDPASIKDAKKRNQFYLDLGQKGIQVTNVFANENGKKVEKLILPGALITYGKEEAAVMLLNGNRSNDPQEILNQSIENVEFELASAIANVTRKERKKIGLIAGHEELEELDIADLVNELSKKYGLYNIDLEKRDDLKGYDAIIINQPKSPYSDEEKYKIDQFIMNGGKALFFIDEIRISMDSIGAEGTYAFTYNHNLGDLLFKYGVRVNSNLIQDLSSGKYPMVVGNFGDQPQIQLMPWPFFPLINKFGESPVVKNLDMVYTRFVSSLDTVKATGVVKTPLLFTSVYSRILNTPVRVNFNDLRKEMNPDYFTKGSIPVAYMLEGEFSSLYKNRILPPFAKKNQFKEQSVFTKILICSDGDLLRNEINYRTNQPYPLGFDPFMQRNFANKEFIVNSLEYMLDEEGLISARRKEVILRPLDKVKIQEEKLKWQIINLVSPVILIIILGSIRQYFRKRKYQ